MNLNNFLDSKPSQTRLQSWQRQLTSEEATPYIWKILELYYRSHLLFTHQHNRYEKMVKEYEVKLGIPRDKIRLGPMELSQLLDFKELERNRDHYLLELKEVSHRLFRVDDRTDFLDRLINDIFHEISILKEEHYNVLTYSPDVKNDLDLEELNTILDEVHKMFPIKVHRLRHLYDLATSRMEKIIRRYVSNKILIRSLFLHRNDDFIAQAYETGLRHFYSLLYGEDSVAKGYVAVGDSFYHGGFYDRALQCYKEGIKYINELSDKEKESWSTSLDVDLDHLKRYETLSQDRIASREQLE